jgi:hypothetical protein
VPGFEEGVLIVGFLALLLMHVSVGFGRLSKRSRELVAASIFLAMAILILVASLIDGFERLSLVGLLVFFGIGAIGLLRYRYYGQLPPTLRW